MGDDLRDNGLIPLEEPFTALGYPHVGGGGEIAEQTVFEVSDLNAIVDWVALELRDKSNHSVVLATRSALLQADGEVVDVDGVSPVTFANLPEDNRKEKGINSLISIVYAFILYVLNKVSHKDLHPNFHTTPRRHNEFNIKNFFFLCISLASSRRCERTIENLLHFESAHERTLICIYKSLIIK